MTAVDRLWAREILRVWFHDLSPADWFGGDDAVDAMLCRTDQIETRSRPGNFFSGVIFLEDFVPYRLPEDG